MPIDAASLENLIRNAIPEAKVRIEDLRGDGDHYAAYIESVAFEGKTRIQQHQMVYAALKDIDLHALAIQTSVPQ
jgi:stress-induced morphogen